MIGRFYVPSVLSQDKSLPQRLRTRIATDLHDDIGSSLSQVSVLSEVVSRRVVHEQSVLEPLSMIAGRSLE